MFFGSISSGKAKELFQGCLQIKSKDSWKVARFLLQKHIQGWKWIHHETIELAHCET